MVALLAQHPVPALFQLDRSFVSRYHNVELQDLPPAFYRVLLYLVKQRAYEDDPSESLFIELRQHHAYTYQCLTTSLSYIEQYDLSQFRAFLTAFPASYPWDDTIDSVDMSLLPLYQLPLQPVEGAPSSSSSQREITSAERRLVEIKGLESPPYAWRGIKTQPTTEHHDMSSILLDSPMDAANTRKENKPTSAKPLNAKAAEWNPIMFSLNTSFDSTKNSLQLLHATHTQDKSKICQDQVPLNDNFLRSRSSLALPALHTTHQRNGGYTFFADGNDHEYFLKTMNRTILLNASNLWTLSLAPKSSLNLHQSASNCKRWTKKETQDTGSISTVGLQELLLTQIRPFALYSPKSLPPQAHALWDREINSPMWNLEFSQKTTMPQSWMA